MIMLIVSLWISCIPKYAKIFRKTTGDRRRSCVHEGQSLFEFFMLFANQFVSIATQQ